MTKTKNTLPDNTRLSIITILQQSLIDAIDLGAQTKQAHWTVKGPSFIALHELFDQLHADVDGFADLLAERIVILGGQPQGTIESVESHSRLAIYPPDISSQDAHIEHLSSSFAKFSEALRGAISEASEIGDEVSADIFTEITRGADKALWLIEAHVSPK